MLNKIYIIALVVFVLVMGVMTYLTYGWTNSIGEPNDAKDFFNTYAGNAKIFLSISAIILLGLANAILWTTRKSWAFWTTLAYFAVFLLARTFWVDRAFLQFQKTNGLVESGISLSPLWGVFTLIAVGIFIYFNQFLLTRMVEKMFDKDAPIKELPDEDAETNDG